MAGLARDKNLARGLALAGRHLAESGDTAGLEILLEAAELSADRDTLQALCAGALALYRPEHLQKALSRLLALAPRDQDVQAFAKSLNAGPLRAVALAQRLSRRQPCRIAPIPGRILYVLHNAMPHASDGYATRSHGLAKGLRELGADLVCLTRPGYPFDLVPDDAPGHDIPEEEIVDGVPYHHLRQPMLSQYPRRPGDYMAHASADYLEKAADSLGDAIRRFRPACVVAASNHVTALPACLAAHAAGLPFIYEVRGFWDITQASRNPAYALSVTGRQERHLEAETARAAEAVLTLTAPMRDELAARGVTPERISLVANSCDPAQFLPQPRSAVLAQRVSLPDGVPVIGYVGSFTQYEGLDDLVRACAALRRRGQDFRLLLVGSEPPDASGRFPLTAKLREIAGRDGLGDWLILPGRVPHGAVSDWYSLIDIAPFPRKPQPVTELVSPMKPIEALSMAKAVVVSSVGGMQDMVSDGETGAVFPAGDLSALEHTLSRLVEDKALRLRLGAAGRDWVVAQRSWKKAAERMLAVLAPLPPGQDNGAAPQNIATQIAPDPGNC